ncbi:MAG: hypothetical protein EAZ14_05895 [Runella slithyformis]|nr:MAG: hypothetical protein EAZ14_05895 [Runella slithyformis]
MRLFTTDYCSLYTAVHFVKKSEESRISVVFKPVKINFPRNAKHFFEKLEKVHLTTPKSSSKKVFCNKKWGLFSKHSFSFYARSNQFFVFDARGGGFRAEAFTAIFFVF